MNNKQNKGGKAQAGRNPSPPAQQQKRVASRSNNYREKNQKQQEEVKEEAQNVVLIQDQQKKERAEENKKIAAAKRIEEAKRGEENKRIEEAKRAEENKEIAAAKMIEEVKRKKKVFNASIQDLKLKLAKHQGTFLDEESKVLAELKEQLVEYRTRLLIFISQALANPITHQDQLFLDAKKILLENKNEKVINLIDYERGAFKDQLESETIAYLNSSLAKKTLSSTGQYIILDIYWLKINVQNIKKSEIAVSFLHQPKADFVVHYNLGDFLKPMLEDSSKINYSILQTLAHRFYTVGFVVHRLVLENNLKHDLKGIIKFIKWHLDAFQYLGKLYHNLGNQEYLLMLGENQDYMEIQAKKIQMQRLAQASFIGFLKERKEANEQKQFFQESGKKLQFYLKMIRIPQVKPSALSA